jgi:ABC-type nitrate/sulfonate/bicarbonate transport system permease component
MMRRWLRRHPGLVGLGILAAFLVLWEVALIVANPTRTVLPRPSAIGEALVTRPEAWWSNLAATAYAAILGFAIGCFLAIGLALLATAVRPLEGAVLRIALALYVAPIIVVAPLIVLWLGQGLQTRVAIAVLACFFGILVNAIRGFRSVGRESLELLHVLAANDRQVFWKVRTPSSLPYLFSALKVAAAAAVLGAIIGEWVGADRGLGVVLYYSLFQFEVARLWAAMVLCAALALLGYGLVGFAERRLIPWHESVRATRLERRA